MAAVWTGLALGSLSLWWFYTAHGVRASFRTSTSAIGVIGHGWIALPPPRVGLFGFLAGEFWRISSLQRAAVVAALTGAALIGLPVRLWALAAGASDRSLASVSAFVRSQVRSDDVAVSELKGYCALREMGLRPLALTYLSAIRAGERDHVTMMTIKPQDFDAVSRLWVANGCPAVVRRHRGSRILFCL